MAKDFAWPEPGSVDNKVLKSSGSDVSIINSRSGRTGKEQMSRVPDEHSVAVWEAGRGWRGLEYVLCGPDSDVL